MTIIPDSVPLAPPFDDALKNYEKHVREEYRREYREGFTSGFILGAGLAGLAALVLLGLKPTSSAV